jgi:hypothetical protein
MDLPYNDLGQIAGYTVALEFAENVKILEYEPSEPYDSIELEIEVKQKFYYELSDAMMAQGLDLDFHPKFTEDEENVVTATYFQDAD